MMARVETPCVGRRRGEQFVASIGKAQRRRLPRAGRGEVGGGQRRAGRGKPGGEGLRQRAFVEAARPVGGDRLERARHALLPEKTSGFGRPVRHKGLCEARPVRSLAAAKGEPERLRPGDRKPVSGARDRVGEENLEGEAASPFPRRPFDRMAPCVDRARGREHGERPPRRDRPVEDGERLRGLADAEESGASPLTVGDEPDRNRRPTRRSEESDSNRRADGDRRLDGVASRAQDLRARRSRERMGARHNSELTGSAHRVSSSARAREAGLEARFTRGRRACRAPRSAPGASRPPIARRVRARSGPASCRR